MSYEYNEKVAAARELLAFEAWLVAAIDADGSMMLLRRETDKHTWRQPRLTIAFRADSGDAIEDIHRTLGVGSLVRGKKNGRNGYGMVYWHVDKIKELAEVIIPMFDRHSFHTKARHEYVYWRRAIMAKYKATDNGNNYHADYTAEFKYTYDECYNAIQTLKHSPKIDGHARKDISDRLVSVA
jgi:hypothetical protein